MGELKVLTKRHVFFYKKGIPQPLPSNFKEDRLTVLEFFDRLSWILNDLSGKPW